MLAKTSRNQNSDLPAGPRRILRVLALLGAAAAGLIPAAAAAADGYRYVLHQATPDPAGLDAAPEDLRSSAQDVAQGPERTLVWAADGDQTTERATFARGERRFGLFVPFWDPSRSPAQEEGWKQYGRELVYRTFDVSLRRGSADRAIAGKEADHYVLEATFSRRSSADSAFLRTKLTSDLWLLPDHPFSFVPFATAGIYEDPRLDAALVEQLGALGMVLRVETRHVRQPQQADGTLLGHPREGAHLAWVTDLRAAEVPAVDLPEARPEVVDALRTALREDPAGTCETLLQGGTPAFLESLLTPAQQAAVRTHLTDRCKERAQRGA